MAVSRFFVELSFNGSGYHGWQRQPNALSVQQTLEEAFSRLLREQITLVGAGRTDAGVHADQMFAHFDSSSAPINCEELVFLMNGFLPNDIALKKYQRFTLRHMHVLMQLTVLINITSQPLKILSETM